MLPARPFSGLSQPIGDKRKTACDKNDGSRELFATLHGYWGITFKNDDSSQHSHPDSTTTLIATSLKPTPLK
jgi:hypothetical protein